MSIYEILMVIIASIKLIIDTVDFVKKNKKSRPNRDK